MATFKSRNFRTLGEPHDTGEWEWNRRDFETTVFIVKPRPRSTVLYPSVLLKALGGTTRRNA